MNTTEMNLAIAGIKKLKASVKDGDVYVPGSFNCMELIDFLSPELNHGLEDELLRLGMKLQYSLFSEEYVWTKPELVYRNENRGIASCMAYIEAFK